MNESTHRDTVLEFAVAKGKGLIKEWSALCKNVFDFINLIIIM